MKAYRAAILRFADDRSAVYERDGLLVVGPDAQGRQVVRAVGDYSTLARNYAGVAIEHLPGRIIAPGFIDLHIHFPQTDMIGSPAPGLLPWLETYTFPHEARFADEAHAREHATFFLDELLRHGVTNALMGEAQRRGLRLIAGKVLQDRHSPDGVRDETVQSLIDTESLIKKWHGVDRLGYAITPRYAPSCSEAQLRGAGELAARYPDVWIQSHVAENLAEVKWACELFPGSRSYLAIYDDFGLMRERAVYAHCIYLDDEDRALMRDRGAAAAVSSTSN